jgi:ABC-type antimicrobial peptide transport system permease subunit
MVLREGILIAAAGLVVGGGVSLIASRAVSGLLFGVSPTDPTTYCGIGILLLAVCCAASYGPARKATQVDPIVALRE